MITKDVITDESKVITLGSITPIFEGVLLVLKENKAIGQIIFDSDSDSWVFLENINSCSYDNRFQELNNLIKNLKCKESKLSFIIIKFE